MSKADGESDNGTKLSRREILEACAQTAATGLVLCAAMRLPGEVPTIPEESVASVANLPIPDLAEAFMRERLAKTSVNSILVAGNGGSLALLKKLRMADIRTADQIPESIRIPGLTTAERELLQGWYDTVKRNYLADYCQSTNPKDTRFLPNAGWWRGLDNKTFDMI